MLNIQQFRYDVDDNLCYLIYGEKTAIAVDPGAVEAMTAFLSDHGLTVQTIVNTHTHPDHTIGNEALQHKTGAELIAMDSLIKNPVLHLEGERIDVYHTPGHSLDSVIFHVGYHLITGDTLFIGKVGRCFTGDLERFFESIKLIMSFPDSTFIYPGHDYVLEYMETARQIEPDNPAIDEFLQTYSPELVRSTLAREYQINPTLRFNAPPLIAILKTHGLAVETELDRWRSIMSLV
jgi:hydroxyacylglutathione hydrolase